MKLIKLPILAFLLLPLSALVAADSPQRPNIIFILADDLGIGNVGCYGADNCKTPNIDKLASTGIRFTHSYTAALCGPSRALIMSGRYAFRNGSSNQDACGKMSTDEIVLPRLFKSAGYVSACIGKWGQLPGDPGDQGFDDFLRYNGSGVYWNQDPTKGIAFKENGTGKKLGNQEYMPDLMHNHLVEFIQKHRTDPFFIYYSLSHVHGEIQPTPDSPKDSKDLFADNIAYMDKLVGKLVAELDSQKLRDNTLILFMGDNGSAKGQSQNATIRGRELSGLKGSMLECGGLVPLIVSWPGHSPSGKVCSDLVDSTDFLPTFAELAGGKLPENTIFDGQSFVPQLLGKPGQPRQWIYNQLARMWYVRDAGWKLNQAGELYDMSDSPFSEKLVPNESVDPIAIAARIRLAAALAKLNPAGGILDDGDGTGRHANKAKKKKSE
jgi:arylsulfatase A